MISPELLEPTFLFTSLLPPSYFLPAITSTRRLISHEPTQNRPLNRVRTVLSSQKSTNWKSINQLNRIFPSADSIVIRWRKQEALNKRSKHLQWTEFDWNNFWNSFFCAEMKTERVKRVAGPYCCADLFTELQRLPKAGEEKKSSSKRSRKKEGCEWSFGSSIGLLISIRMREEATTRWSGECKHKTVIIKLLMIMLVERRSAKKQSITPFRCHSEPLQRNRNRARSKTTQKLNGSSRSILVHRCEREGTTLSKWEQCRVDN